ncbi:MAG: fluoride efflux transporter FluC [Acidimicrobiia bacterium]
MSPSAPPASASAAAAVATGAVAGSSARWAAGEAFATGGFPWATLIVNLLGCAAIGWLAMRLERGTIAWYFAVTGCLGGLTTASAFAVESRQLLDDGRIVTASIYVTTSVLGGLALVAATRHLAERVGR